MSNSWNDKSETLAMISFITVQAEASTYAEWRGKQARKKGTMWNEGHVAAASQPNYKFRSAN